MQRKRIKVQGIVQGVGFRPFVYRCARDLSLSGYVRNTTDGVDVEVQGSPDHVARFIRELHSGKPPAARIDSITVETVSVRKEKTFDIKVSGQSQGFTHISPDIATCADCLAEMYDSHDRRYHFPFINCTNCGPRYSILQMTPYDRERTSMRCFVMCRDCEREFKNVSDRRFHAQPDCCAACGPVFELHTIDSTKVSAAEPIAETARVLKSGKIIAIKGIGGFHIACDATNRRAVKQLRELKHRPAKPFAVMASLHDIRTVAFVSKDEEKILTTPIAPILLLRKKKGVICEEVAPNNPYLGIMVPYAPVHHLLLDHIPFLVMTSANIQDEPIVKEDDEVIEKLGAIVSYYLTHNRGIENRCDDSVGFYLDGKGFSILRRSRGYVPVPIGLPHDVVPTLAVGPYLKNTFTLAHKRDAYVSPHIGDLDNLETLTFFNEMIAKYKKWFRIRPELIVHDLHPDYLSTKIAQDMGGKKVAVQHHMAHIVSCLGEHQVRDDAIGIAFDGTGYGTDGKIWGGEFFVGNLEQQRRVAHLEYLPLPGGEASIRKPYRIALAYVHTLLGRKDLPRVRGRSRQTVSRRETQTLVGLLQKEHNIVYTSSMGRLFDCIASLVGLVQEITYEAEAAINLEYIAPPGVRTCYPYHITETEPLVIGVRDMIETVVDDVIQGVEASTISAKFHNTVAAFSLDMAEKLCNMYGIKKVCLSGGVFQNRYLLNLMIDLFENRGFTVYVHQQLPTNDGCISYGQTILGNAISQR
jgi:hydrogenase maturation protein HypF